MERMLIHSDNRATDILFKDLGGPDARSRLAAATTESRASASTARSRSCCAAKRDLWDTRDSSTPKAMVDLLKRIYKAELIKRREPQLPARTSWPSARPARTA